MINYTSLEEAWGIENLNDEKKEKEKEKKDIYNVIKTDDTNIDNKNIDDKNIDDKNIDNKNTENNNVVKEQFKNNSFNNLNNCDTLNHILSCDKCLEKLKEKLKINQKIIVEKSEKVEKPQKTQEITNKIKNKLFSNNIEGFSFKIPYNRHIVLYLTIIGILILSILLIHSYRKPLILNTNNKKFYIFPEDLDKLKSLIDIARK